MSTIALAMSMTAWKGLHCHLLPGESSVEQGAFLLTNFEPRPLGGGIFWHLETELLQREDYESQEDDYLELRDETRARLIKLAHDRQASLVEFHSHPSPYPACFSLSDIKGLEDFVPHVRWRLKGRPYAAVVVAPSGFDGLAWIGPDADENTLGEIQVDRQRLSATGLTARYCSGRLHG